MHRLTVMVAAVFIAVVGGMTLAAAVTLAVTWATTYDSDGELRLVFFTSWPICGVALVACYALTGQLRD